MAKLSIWLLCFLLPAGFAFAQENNTKKVDVLDEPEKQAYRKKVDLLKPPQYVTKWGVMGNLSTGITFGFFGKLQDDLKTESMYHNDFVVKKLGSAFGFELDGMIGNRFIVGVGYTRYSYDASLGLKPDPSDSTKGNTEKGQEYGEARIKSRSMYAKVGYAVFNRTRYVYDDEIGEYAFKYRWLLYPYAGFNFGNKTTMKLSNFSLEDQYFGQEGPDEPGEIPRSEYQEFTTAVNMLEIGVGSRFMKSPKGGLTLGAEAGVYFNMGKGKWQNSAGKDVVSVNQATLSGVYIRVTAGLGFLSNQPYDINATRKEKGDDGFVEPDKVDEEKAEKERLKKEEKEKKDKEKEDKKKKKADGEGGDNGGDGK